MKNQLLLRISLHFRATVKKTNNMRRKEEIINSFKAGKQTIFMLYLYCICDKNYYFQLH